MHEHWSRRDMLTASTLGFGSLALASLLHDDKLLAGSGGMLTRPSFQGRAKSVVFFLVGGGPSQTDLYDPKPLLQQLDGQDVPESIAKDIPKIARTPLTGLLASPWKFRPYEESGIPVSELVPETAQCVDDLCIVRSCQHNSPIHAPAEYLTLTGSLLGNRPSLGAWLSYGLGSENHNLPSFIVFRTGETVRPPGIASGFLPARYQGTQVDSQRGIAHLRMPDGVTSEQRQAQLEFMATLNRQHAQRLPGNSDLEARIQAYELSFRMQMAAPEAFDLSTETPETQDLYGLHDKTTAEYAQHLLLTRRLVERGVRFIQIRSGGWDAHSDHVGNHGGKCRATDRPIAAFLKDLKRRGLLDQTLVVWGGEFGRTPACQRGAAKPGRDHSPSGYTMWLAGGGVRGGQIIGATDPVGYNAIERPIHPHDLHATILQALGVDQHALYYEHNNRRELVTVLGGKVVTEVFTG